VESLENSKGEFPTLSTVLGNPAKDAGFPQFHSAGGGSLSHLNCSLSSPAFRLQLTDVDQFGHDDFTSVASLRP
jgi:hypothetical protein